MRGGVGGQQAHRVGGVLAEGNVEFKGPRNRGEEGLRGAWGGGKAERH